MGKRIIWIVIVEMLGIFLCGFGYGEKPSEEDIVKLKKELKKQEKEVVKNNKGYIFRAKITSKRIDESTAEMIKNLWQEAYTLYRKGEFEEAKVRLRKIIELDPLHIPARRMLRRILECETNIQYKNNLISAREKMLEVDKAWLPAKKVGEGKLTVRGKITGKSEQLLKMEKKAKQIIPEINFRDAHIRDVLKYLSDISGINIVIDEDLFPKREKPEIPQKVEVGTEKSVKPAEFSGVSDRITISLHNIPLIEALKYILSTKGLKYRIDKYAILVTTPERLAEVEMKTRYYHLKAGAGIFTEFAKRLKTEEGTKGMTGEGLEEKRRITIKDVLEQSGVPFPPGSKAFLDRRTGILIVRNTPQNLALVEDVLRMLDITPYQVEIEARFVELTESVAKELGLEWMITSNDFRFANNRLRWDSDTTDILYGQYPDALNKTGREGITHGLRYLEDTSSEYPTPSGNILSISGVLTKPEFKMILHALNQSGNVNVLSAPKVTTLNNQQAQIQEVTEIIYPTEFEVTPPTTNDYGTVVTQPVVTPTEFTKRDVGIILNVTPSVGADRNTITLTLHPEVSKLARWEDYGIEAGENWSAIPILQPIFSVEDVETNVVLHNGETVVLGGLIKEEQKTTNDKIPLLGDIPVLGNLFRSKTKVDEKTSLVIFVTVNLLTPSGERVK